MINLFGTKRLIFATCLLATSLGAQQSAGYEKVDSTHIQHILDSVEFYKIRGLPKAKTLALAALKLSKGGNLYSVRARAYLNLGQIVFRQEAQDSAALLYYDSAIIDLRRHGNSTLVSIGMMNKADVYLQQNRTKQALKTVYEAIDVIANEKDPNFISHYVTLGNIYNQLKLLDSAIHYYEKALPFTKGSLSKASIIHLNIGSAYQGLGDNEKAYIYQKKAYKGFKQGNNLLAQTVAAFNLGIAMSNNESYKQAKNYLKESMTTAKKISYQEYYCKSLIGMGNLYINLGLTDSGFYYLDKGERLSDSLNFPTIHVTALGHKSKAYELTGDSLKAMQYHKLWRVLNDSLSGLQDTPGSLKTILKRKQQEHQEKLMGYRSLLKKINYWLLVAVIGALFMLILSTVLLKRYLHNKLRFNTEKNTLKTEKAYVKRKLASTTVNLARQRKLLIDIAKTLRTVKLRSDTPELSETIKKTQSYIKEQLEVDQLWEDFFLHFNEIHPDFLYAIQAKYKLTKGEIKLCAFVKMKLSNKEMSQVLNVKYSSLRTSLHRLKKKLNVPEDTSLTDFLIFYEKKA